ncbi:hypothetical protein RCCGEPOP_06516 [Rhizobium sp. Pop5]|nr:hypothetical protein RCCGEPOP_06516 [Rhizobium sp. Pop5]
MAAPLEAAKVAWRAGFDKLDIAEIEPGPRWKPGAVSLGQPFAFHRRVGLVQRDMAVPIGSDCRFSFRAYSLHRSRKGASET